MAPETMGATRQKENASVTLVALCFTVVLAIALGSYLALCGRSYDLSTRQVHNDKARELALVGLEEALWALNQNNWGSSGPASGSAWATSGADRSVTLTYSALGQGESGQVVLTVASYASAGPAWPTITSSATITLGDGRTMAKTLQATTKPAPLFGNALASANSYVSFVSQGTVDSWNSDPGNTGSYTTPYSFTAGNPTNYAAVVAATDTDNDYDGTHAVVLNQALIKGYVATAGKTVSYSTSGSPHGKVQGPATAPAIDVDDMRLGKSAFIPASPVFQVTLPPTSGPTYGGLLNDILDLLAALLGSPPPAVDTYEVNGDLIILGIPILSPDLTISRPMKLIVDGNLSIAGAGQITVTPAGSLQIFVAGDVSIGANGIQNQTVNPRKVAIFCTSNSTSNSVQYTSAAGFYGVIYSVNKPIDFQQNGPFYGALLSGQYVRFSGSATAPVFHYDTALRTVRFSNVSTPYVIDQLTEP